MKQESNTFKYSNKTYTLTITLKSSQQSADPSMSISLDGQSIESFEYSTKLNDLLVTGKITYVDRYAKVDKLMNQNYPSCVVYFVEHKEPKENQHGYGDPDPQKTFLHTFIVADIKILERQANFVKYDIELVSDNWIQCISNVSYSNYNNAQEPMLQILKNCLVSHGLQVDVESFDKSMCVPKMHYISQRNDNLFSVKDLMLNNLYYFPSKEESMKFLLFDLFDSKYKIFDLKDKSTILNDFSTVLSMFKTDMETAIQQEPTNLGSLKKSIGKPYVYKSMFTSQMYGYSYEKNAFTNTTTPDLQNVRYLNNRIDNSDSLQKFLIMPSYPGLSFKRNGSYWNNDINFYEDASKILEENDALILNITGEILRQPGSTTSIVLDRSLKNLTSDTKKALEEEKKKYKNLEGLWFNSKVQSVINMQKGTFRQNVVMFRNFINTYEENS